jgi:ribosome-associated toxin RatA of RatAB toxin-antitoxin module
MRVCRSVLVRRDPEAVFALVADVARYPEFFRGMTRWEPCTDQVREVGACYRILMQVGSIEAGGVICTTEWDEPRTIAWTGERGIRQRGRWTLEPVADGTRLTLEVGFFLPGPLRWPVERLAGRIIGRNIHATLLAARRLLERGEHVRAA